MRRSALAGLAVLAGLMPVPARAEAPSLTVYVVTPDGLPASSPYVATFSIDTADAPVHWFRGGPDGRVDIRVPIEDSAVADRARAGEPVTLLTLIMDRPPGSPEPNATYVASSLNLSGSLLGLPVDVSGVQGRVFTLEPGRTDFVKVGLPSRGGDSGDGGTPTSSPSPWAGWPDEPDCPPYYHYCEVADYPPWSQHTKVPIGDNYGAGKEMQAYLRYETSTLVKTSIAVSGGASGFAEVSTPITYKEKLDGRRFGFPNMGPNQNEKIYLDTEMERIRKGICTWEEPGNYDSERHCQLTTIYRPYQAIAPYTHPAWHSHDAYQGPTTDCRLRVNEFQETMKGQIENEGFELQLGPNEAWATGLRPESRGLHATVTITGSTTDSENFVRGWRVVGHQHEYHILYVRDGLRPDRYDIGRPGGGRGNCPWTGVENVSTAALDQDPAVYPLPDPPDPSPSPTPMPSSTYVLCDRGGGDAVMTEPVPGEATSGVITGRPVPRRCL